MLRKPRFHFAAIGLIYLCAPAAFAAPQDTLKTKLAVLKIVFIDLSLEEQNRLRMTRICTDFFDKFLIT